MPKETLKEKVQRAYFAATSKHRIRVIEETGAIFIYDPVRGVYRPNGESLIRSTSQIELGIGVADNHIKSVVVGSVRDSEGLQSKLSDFDSEPDLLCVRNGVLNVANREFIDHSPTHRFLRYLDVDYDPDADCPDIKRFLGEVAYPRDQILLQQFIGFLLMAGYKYHKAFTLVGTGDNGKTTFLNTLQQFVGEGNYSSLTLQQLSHEKFLQPQLVGKLANIAPEMGSGAIKDTEMLKAITGESSVTMQDKGEKGFTTVNSAKIIFGCNETPPAPGADDAFYKRFIVIPFPNTFDGSHKDENKLASLTTDAEKSGLLNYALDGRDLLESAGGFDYPVTVDDIKIIWDAWSGSMVHKFIAVRLVKEQGARSSKTLLFGGYCVFCKEQGRVPVSESMFWRQFYALVGDGVREIRERVGDTRPYTIEGVRMVESGLDVTIPYHGVSLAPSSFVD